MNGASLKRRAIRVFIIYSLDMLIAIAGWVYGFGLTVQNWPALIALCLFTRFIFHIMAVAIAFDDAKEIKP